MSTRTIPWRLVDELHALADQLAAGELPERGAAAELGRKIEAAINERRPKRRPHERTTQARLLARHLSQRTGMDVSLSYSPFKGYDGKVTGWKVEWTDGPADLTYHVAALADRVPAIDTAALHYERCQTDRAGVAALIRHLDTHSDDGPAYAATWHDRWDGSRYHRLDDLARRAWDTADYPERMDDQTERLAAAVFRLAGHDHQHLGSWYLDHRCLDRLAEQIRHDGWPAARVRLAALASGQGGA
ncbi:hypothetical protein [Flindersiella endophytica]